MKLSSLFKINNKKNTCVNEIYIGNNRFVIIEIKSRKTNIIKDKVINFLLTSDLDVCWFSTYNEMENCINYFNIDTFKGTNFIIIG